MTKMRYLSVCSGIEAATVAWAHLGWSAAGFAEIEKFPSAVLAHHYPEVPNHGDFTKIEASAADGIDLLVGGTPCQSFSVAGLRGGLADDRGNLALEFLRLAQRTRPNWLVWENVPGVLSSGGGRDFGAFLGGLAELGYGWAYRVLDAQFFGVAQRRRRVFVVGYLGDWRRAAAVLFERQGLSGDPAPSREAREGSTGTLTARSKGRGPGADEAAAGQLIAGTLVGKTRNTCDETFVTHTLRGDGFDASEDGTGRGTPLVPVAFDTTQITHPENRCNPQPGDPCHPLASGAHAPAIAFNARQDPDVWTERCGPLDTDGSTQAVVSVLAIRGRDGESRLESRSDGTANAIVTPNGGRGGIGVGAIHTGSAVRRLTPRECERLQGFPDDYTLVPVGKRMAADGPRYKALGNSMAVPVMRWIGKRIIDVEAR